MAESKKLKPKMRSSIKNIDEEVAQLVSLAKELDSEIEASQNEFYKTNPPKFGIAIGEPEQEIGKRLVQARDDKGLTQGQLSELTVRADKDGKGISRAVISLYESGTNRPGLKEIRLLCECLRVTPSYLIYGEDDPFEQMTDYGRFYGLARSEAEYYANLLYLFKRLHKHHSQAIMKIMHDLLRLWDKGFDVKMAKEAFPLFLEMADKLKSELKDREEQTKK